MCGFTISSIKLSKGISQYFQPPEENYGTYEMWYYQCSCKGLALNIKHLNEETLINS